MESHYKINKTLGISDFLKSDELHTGGEKVTFELIKQLNVSENMNAIDIGGGLGGPARKLAKATGCNVSSIDLSPDFYKTAIDLTKHHSLEDKVTHFIGDATNMAEFENESFDAAWTLHAGMNIKKKEAYYKEAYRVLKPNSKFIIYDVFINDGAKDIQYPVPWTSKAETSFLITTDELKSHLNNAKFEILDTIDKTAIGIDFFTKSLENIHKKHNPIMGKTAETKIHNLLANLEENKLSVHCFICKKKVTVL